MPDRHGAEYVCGLLVQLALADRFHAPIVLPLSVMIDSLWSEAKNVCFWPASPAGGATRPETDIGVQRAASAKVPSVSIVHIREVPDLEPRPPGTT